MPIGEVDCFLFSFGYLRGITYNGYQMALNVWCQTDVGLKRENNQDFVLFDEEVGLYIVADGMGGHRGGEVASKMAAETLLAVVRAEVKGGGTRRPNPRIVLAKGFEEASRRIYEKSKENNGELAGMGTTLVALFAQGDSIYIANVGDSRAYLFKDNCLWQMTEDHSLLNEQLRAGIITESEVANFVGKNVITRSVGFENSVVVDIIERQYAEGELFILCSDGLSGLVVDSRISEICTQCRVDEIVPKCIHEAKKNGGDDNVSVMVVSAGRRDG